MICSSQGYTVGAYTLASGAYCCGAAAAAVTASQSPGWVRAWQAAAAKLGNGARVLADGTSKVGLFVAECTMSVCKMVRRARPRPGLPTRSIDPPPVDEKSALLGRDTEPKEDEIFFPRYVVAETGEYDFY